MYMSHQQFYFSAQHSLIRVFAGCLKDEKRQPKKNIKNSYFTSFRKAIPVFSLFRVVSFCYFVFLPGVLRKDDKTPGEKTKNARRKDEKRQTRIKKNAMQYNSRRKNEITRGRQVKRKNTLFRTFFPSFRACFSSFRMADWCYFVFLRGVTSGKKHEQSKWHKPATILRSSIILD